MYAWLRLDLLHLWCDLRSARLCPQHYDDSLTFFQMHINGGVGLRLDFWLPPTVTMAFKNGNHAHHNLATVFNPCEIDAHPNKRYAARNTRTKPQWVIVGTTEKLWLATFQPTQSARSIPPCMERAPLIPPLARITPNLKVAQTIILLGVVRMPNLNSFIANFGAFERATRVALDVLRRGRTRRRPDCQLVTRNAPIDVMQTHIDARQHDHRGNSKQDNTPFAIISFLQHKRSETQWPVNVYVHSLLGHVVFD